MRALKIGDSFTTRESETFKKYLRDVSDIELFDTPQCEAECAERASKGCKKSTDELVRRNLRFVISVAKQYLRAGVKLEDLVNEGNIGLIEAANKFNPTLGNKFISYAVWYIRKDIRGYLYSNERQVRMPINKVNDIHSLKKVIHNLEQKLGRSVDANDIIYSEDDFLINENLSKDDIRTLIGKSYGKSHSIDNPIQEDGSTLHEIMPSNAFKSNDYSIINSESINRLNDLLNTLDSKSVKVIRMYFGIGYEYEMGLFEISEEMNLTRERVRQIKISALNKLKNTAEIYGNNTFTLN